MKKDYLPPTLANFSFQLSRMGLLIFKNSWKIMKINKTYSILLVFCQFNAVPSEFFWHNFDTIQRIFNLPKQARKKSFSEGIWKSPMLLKLCIFNNWLINKIYLNVILTLFTLVTVAFHYQKLTNIFGKSSNLTLMKIRNKNDQINYVLRKNSVSSLPCASLHKSRHWSFQVEYNHMDT